jgi:hypothetical protein
MTEQKQQYDYQQIENHYLFKDIFAFIKESSGLAFTISYLILVLSSMAYLHVLYSAFDIPIVAFISLEDILATPLKNPNILMVFLSILMVLIIVDIGNRLYARMQRRLAGKKQSIWMKLIRLLIWVPKTRKTNIRVTVAMTLFFLSLYVLSFANGEARDIKQGLGDKVLISLADSDKLLKQTLLGTTSQFAITYDHQSNKSRIYNIETIDYLEPYKIAPTNDPKPKTTTSN